MKFALWRNDSSDLSPELERLVGTVESQQVSPIVDSHVRTARAQFKNLWEEASLGPRAIHAPSLPEFIARDPEGFLQFFDPAQHTMRERTEVGLRLWQSLVDKDVKPHAGYQPLYRGIVENLRLKLLPQEKPDDVLKLAAVRERFMHEPLAMIEWLRDRIMKSGSLEHMRPPVLIALRILQHRPSLIPLFRRKLTEFLTLLVYAIEYIPLRGTLEHFSAFTVERHLEEQLQASKRGGNVRFTEVCDDAVACVTQATTPRNLSTFCGFLRFFEKHPELLTDDAAGPIVVGLLENLRLMPSTMIPEDVLSFLKTQIQQGAVKRQLAESTSISDESNSLPITEGVVKKFTLDSDDLDPFLTATAEQRSVDRETQVRTDLKDLPPEVTRLVGRWWHERVEREGKSGSFPDHVRDLIAYLDAHCNLFERSQLTRPKPTQTGAIGPKVPISDQTLSIEAWLALEHSCWLLSQGQLSFGEAIARNSQITHLSTEMLASRQPTKQDLIEGLRYGLALRPEQFILRMLERHETIYAPLLREGSLIREILLQDVLPPMWKHLEVIRGDEHLVLPILEFLAFFSRYDHGEALQVLRECLSKPHFREGLSELEKKKPIAELLRAIAYAEVEYPSVGHGRNVVSEEQLYSSHGRLRARTRECTWITSRDHLPEDNDVNAALRHFDETLRQYLHPNPLRRQERTTEFSETARSIEMHRRLIVLAASHVKGSKEWQALMQLIRGFDLLIRWKRGMVNDHDLERALQEQGIIRITDITDVIETPGSMLLDFTQRREASLGRGLLRRQLPILDLQNHVRALLSFLTNAQRWKRDASMDENTARSQNALERLRQEINDLQKGAEPRIPMLPGMQSSVPVAPEIVRPPTIMSRIVSGKLTGTHAHLFESFHDQTDRRTYEQTPLDPLPPDLEAFLWRAFEGSDVPTNEVTIEYKSVRNGSILHVPFGSRYKEDSFQSDALLDGEVRKTSQIALRVDSQYLGRGSARATFLVPCCERQASAASIADVQAALPPAFAHLAVEEQTHLRDFPVLMQEAIARAKEMPAAHAANHLMQAASRLYKYNKEIRHAEAYKRFIERRAKQRASKQDECLAMIHSFSHGRILGEGMCWQLMYVLGKALRLTGVPTLYTGGYLASRWRRDITENDAHAYPTVLLLDHRGEWMLHCLGITSGVSMMSGGMAPPSISSTTSKPEVHLQEHPQTMLATIALQETALDEHQSTINPDLEPATLKVIDDESPLETPHSESRYDANLDATISTDLQRIHRLANMINRIRRKRMERVLGLLQSERCPQKSEGSLPPVSILQAYTLLTDPRNQSVGRELLPRIEHWLGQPFAEVFRELLEKAQSEVPDTGTLDPKLISALQDDIDSIPEKDV